MRQQWNTDLRERKTIADSFSIKKQTEGDDMETAEL